MTKNDISYKDIYELIDKRTDEIKDLFETFHRDEFIPLQKQVTENKEFLAVIQTRLMIAGAMIIFATNMAWDFVKDKILKGI